MTWNTDTRWFDVALVMSIFAVGGVLFGRFEEHKPRPRRLAKIAVVLLVALGLAEWAGRAWAFAWLAAPLLGAAYVHLVWLPKHGINGWTAEPRDRYLALVSARHGSGGAESPAARTSGPHRSRLDRPGQRED